MSKEARAQALHKEVREEITRADSKATTLLSVVGLLLGALIAGAIAGNVDPRKLDDSIEWLFWTGGVLGVAAAGLLLWAVLPETAHPDGKNNLRYFGHVVGYEGDREGLRAALEEADGEYERSVDQVAVLSGLVQAKYEGVRRALLALSVGTGCVVASILLDFWVF